MNIYLNLFSFIILVITVILLIVFFVKLFVYFVKKRLFPKRLLIATLTGIILVLGIFLYTQYFFTFNNLKGTLQEGPINSPNGKYTANAYYKSYGGAAGGVDIWIEITNNDSQKTKVIYYSDANSHFSINWMGDNTLAITNEEPTHPESDNSVNLDVRDEIYDQNGLACQSLLMKNDYKRCFKK